MFNATFYIRPFNQCVFVLTINFIYLLPVYPENSDAKVLVTMTNRLKTTSAIYCAN